jgi:DNA polymerase-3 subunit delta'
MQFKDIEGQQVLANRLTEIIDAGRISHAQLFLGPTASGSLALAVAYAQYLCCEHRQHYPEGSPLLADSCGECPSCRKFAQLMHSDLHLVFPTTTTATVTSKPCAEDFYEEFRAFLADTGCMGTEDDWYTRLGVENKQGMIRERDADNIIRALGMKSYEGGYKVVVVWMAERMNLVTANTLLKTLEEPAEKTLLLLVAESRDRLLPTIMSRVQQVVVPNRGTGLSEERREAFAALFVSWMRLLFKLNMQPLSAWVDQAAGMGRETQKLFLQYVLEALRACFLQTAAGYSLESELQFGDAKFDTAFPARIKPANIEQMNEAVNEALYAIERNANAKITFMQLSFKMSRCLKK